MAEVVLVSVDIKLPLRNAQITAYALKAYPIKAFRY